MYLASLVSCPHYYLPYPSREQSTGTEHGALVILPGSTPDTSVHRILVSGLLRGTKLSQALEGIVLHSGKQEAVQSQQWAVFPYGQGASKGCCRQLACLYPSVPQKILQTLAVEFEILKTGNMPKDQ